MLAMTSVSEKPRGREAQRLETRQRVYDAAIAEFKRSGMAEADIGAIVSAAGVAVLLVLLARNRHAGRPEAVDGGAHAPATTSAAIGSALIGNPPTGSAGAGVVRFRASRRLR